MKNKRPFKVRERKYLLKSIKIAILESLIQSEAQIMLQLGDKGNEYLGKREGEQLHQ